MQKVLKQGLLATCKNTRSIYKYGMKNTIKSLCQKNINQKTQLQNQFISFKYSTDPNNSGNQKSQNDNNNFTRNDKDQSKNTQQQQNPQSGRFFYSHTKMSSHYILKEDEVYDLLNKFDIQYKQSLNNSQIQIEWCPFCLKPHNNDISNAYTLGIKKQSGQFNCFRCGIHGSWWDFKNLLYKNISINDFRNYSQNYQQQQEERMDDSEYYLYHNQLFDKEVYKEELNYICGKENSTQRHINFETLVKYKIGIGKEDFINKEGDVIKVPVVYFPMFKFEKVEAESSDEDKARDVFQDETNGNSQRITISTNSCKLIKCKIRGIGSENKKYMRVKPSGSKSGIFGLNTVPQNAKELVITEGEYDAMAVNQATGLPAVSLPNGASNLPLEVIECLEKIEKIYLWLDNDEVGRNNRQKLAEKLGVHRTYIVNTLGEKDANDILRQDPSRIIKYIQESATIPDQNILMFSDLKDLVLHRLLKFEHSQGYRSRRFEFFNETIKGLRRGEMTVLTGPTGSGKTTFLSQLSLDFCTQQVPTLWGSFEIKNEVLATNMIMQMSGQDLFKNHNKFPYWAQRFDMIPMYFMNFYGSTNLDQIISTIEYSIYKYDIQHVVIDNLQFLLGTQAKGFSKFDLQERAIEAFRQLATKKDIHLTLVIHPKKVDENEDLNISSVFGSAKATQEADNVIIMQNRDKYRVIDIKKNRFNGDIGKKAIIFDKSNKNFYEMSLGEVSEILSSKKTISDIVKFKREKILEKIEEEDQVNPVVDIKRNKSGNPNNNKNNDGDDNGGSNTPPSSSSNPPSSNTPPSSGTPPPPSSSSASAASSNQIEDVQNADKQSLFSAQKQQSQLWEQNNQKQDKKSEDKSKIQKSKKQNENIEIIDKEDTILNVMDTQAQQESIDQQKDEVQLNLEESLEQIEIIHKNNEAVDQIESNLSLNYNYEDEMQEAINEELIEQEIQGQKQQQQIKQKNKNIYKKEEYDTDSLEPMNFDLYQQEKEVKTTVNFFKNYSPVPPEEREDLINGSFKKSNPYNKYTNENKVFQFTEEFMEQIFSEKYEANSDISNKILSKQHKSEDDLSSQIIEKKFQEKRNKQNKI
ncbi:toprim domain protein (macronuclear) [Tetrahymena thermophila SB210]|uniref:Toprim domain protein n=1 Tax=Tetrahymena thermophila (strain SB210) TaxID=312017 RepID=I7M671_TETTS|nr:toprim domain protein [Tetrahymena thermophila SB210]EAR84473.1 toprim domain protein [Tetrahymena thermophila SB210]|eukprot:XP_001032136.1 toprim domain protein [Tetrahymena thermophila SB210]